MVRRCPHERQTERHVDGAVEGQRLDRDQRLVVIHRHDDIVTGTGGGVEQRIGGVRPGDRDVLRAQASQRRHDDVDILATDVAPFTGMRIEAGDGDAWRGEAEPRRKIAGHDAHRLDDQVLRDETRDAGDRYVDGRRDDGERRRPQQHHRMAVGTVEALRHRAHELRLAWIGIADAMQDLL